MKSAPPSKPSPTTASARSAEFVAVDEAFFAALKPPERLTVSQWADRYRWLAGEAASEPGKFHTSRTPYTREIMDSLSASSPVEVVVFVAGAQVGKTEIGLNWVGETIDQSAGSMLIVWPTEQSAKRNSRLRLKPLIASSPVLRARVRPSKSRDSGNSTLVKEFPGGLILVAGANSAAGLISTPVGKLLLDEIDTYPQDVDGQGDPVELAMVRTRTFAHSRKCYLTSTPTTEGRSRIQKHYEAGDQRKFEVPCPHCGHFQPLVWDRMRWDEGDPESVRYYCRVCNAAIEEQAHKPAMLAAGRWVATNPDADPRVRSYHLSSLYAPIPWFVWPKIVAEFLKAKGDPSLLRVWTNTVLGECWREKGEAPEWEKLYHRREEYSLGSVPRRALILTAGVDVQRDRLECEIVGWGRDFETWSIGYFVIPGDTEKRETWAPLWLLLSSTFPHEGGLALPVRMAAVDAGDRQNTVLSMTRTQSPDRVMAVKGFARRPTLVGNPIIVDVKTRERKIYRGAALYPVGTGHAYAELYGWLRHERPTDSAKGFPRGYAHFPQHPEEYFRQLCAMELVKRVRRGIAFFDWEQARERNEALDCRVYARAAASVIGLDWMQPEHWDALEASLVLDPADAPGHPGAKPGEPAAPPAPDQTDDGPAGRRGISRPDFWKRFD